MNNDGRNPPMTVGQLRELLAPFPSDLRVLVDGYEGGLDDPRVEHGIVAFDVHEGDCMGDHTRIDEAYGETKAIADSVILTRRTT